MSLGFINKSKDLFCPNRAFRIFLNELLERSRCLRKTRNTYIHIVGKYYFTLEQPLSVTYSIHAPLPFPI